MYAAESGQEDVVWSLLGQRADPNACDARGDTALSLACHRQLEGTMRILWERGSDADDAIARVRNPLMRRLLLEWRGACLPEDD